MRSPVCSLIQISPLTSMAETCAVLTSGNTFRMATLPSTGLKAVSRVLPVFAVMTYWAGGEEGTW